MKIGYFLGNDFNLYKIDFLIGKGLTETKFLLHIISKDNSRKVIGYSVPINDDIAVVGYSGGGLTIGLKYLS